MSTADQALDCVIEYVGAKTKSTAYVALTDLPSKAVAEAPAESSEPEEPPESTEAPEGEASAAELAGEGEEGGEGSTESVPKPKHIPNLLSYAGALSGKALSRPAAPVEEGEAADAAPLRGCGEGVSFDAVDAFLEGGARSLLVKSAFLNRSVKFWGAPRPGDLAMAPFVLPLDAAVVSRPAIAPFAIAPFVAAVVSKQPRQT